MKYAEIISVGTELLMGDTVDTNAATMGQVLAASGVACRHRQTVGDNLERLTQAIKLALSRADIVITIGGLGPTEDDLTRQGIADAFQVPLIDDPQLATVIRQLFEKRGYRWVESNLRQAQRPEFCEAIPNPNGSAPGLRGELNGKWLFALPGPPREFNPMATGAVAETLRSLSDSILVSKTLRVAGLGESRVEELLKDLIHSENPTLAPYAKSAEVHLRITAAAATSTEAVEMVADLEARVRDCLGKNVYGVNDETLESRVLKSLVERGETVSVAESMTAGALGARFASVPGASGAFLGGIIAYSKEVKRSQLNVPASVLEKYGAVSAETAEAMAIGVRGATQSTWSISITGNAGPSVDTGSPEVGRVFVAIAGPTGVKVNNANFGTNRATIIDRATQFALYALYETLQGD